MHPILVEMFSKPVGWLTIVGAILLFGTPVAIFLFVRRKMRQEEEASRRR